MDIKELSTKLMELKNVIKSNHNNVELYGHLTEIGEDRDINVWTFDEFLKRLKSGDIELSDVVNDSEFDEDATHFVYVKYDSYTKAPSFNFFGKRTRVNEYLLEELEPYLIECIECYEEYGTSDDEFLNDDIAKLFED